ncbi:hypothetical protein G6F40_013847 [Rhizopus arrhizus]|nr:hypothetical protein G6F40_013847 [Rhizopus arrhizus]
MPRGQCRQQHRRQHPGAQHCDQASGEAQLGHPQPQRCGGGNQADLVVGVGVLGRAGDGDHVVQAHHEVGDDDGLDRGGDGCPALHVAMRIVFRNQELDADPDEQQAAHDFQERDRQERQCESDQHDTQDDGARGAPQDALHALLGGQIATSQRDHDGVVAAQQDVDEDDLEYRCPTQRLEKLKHYEPPKAFMKRKAGPEPAILPRAAQQDHSNN